MTTDFSSSLDSIVILGVFAGGTHAFRAAFVGQPTRNIIAAVLGGALAGGLGAWALGFIRHAMPQECVPLIEGHMAATLVHWGPEATRMLREHAAKFLRLAEAEVKPGGRCFARIWYAILVWFMHFLAGTVNGIQSSMALKPRW